MFPGIGLAASVAGVQRITDRMLYVAAVACAEAMTDEEIAAGRTFPAIQRIRDVSHAVACAVIEEGIAKDLTTKIPKDITRDGLRNLVARKMYYPQYVPLVDSRSQ